MSYLDSLQYIAYNIGGGNRAADSPGYNASVDFVAAKLKDHTNYTITTQPFTISSFTVNSASELSQTSPDVITYQNIIDFNILTYSGSGDVTAQISPAGDGCTDGVFEGFPVGNIAVIARGTCDFAMKAENAAKAGATGVIVYNYVDQGIFSGTLGSLQELPVLSTTYEIASTWLDSTPYPTLHMVTDTSVTTTYTQNIIAESLYGNSDSIIVVGSHLDSVPAGPGINDNGSGSAANLEMALNFAYHTENVNKVRFCWFGAEELGLLGSEYYVSTLVESGDIKNVALNLNFDMIGSPNYVRAIYDGSGAAPEIRSGSIKIQNLFEDYFNFNALNYTLTPFNGRSDYGPFIENGVPAGGLFTGAEEVKDMEGRSTFGGLANTPYDPCYHRDCDTIENISVPALDEMGKAAYFSLIELAYQDNLLSWLGDSNTQSERKFFHKHEINRPKSHPYLTKY